MLKQKDTDRLEVKLLENIYHEKTNVIMLISYKIFFIRQAQKYKGPGQCDSEVEHQPRNQEVMV